MIRVTTKGIRMKNLVLIAPALLLAACGGETPKAEDKPVIPAKLPAGEWEVSSTVEALKSTDQTTPDIALKQGDTATHRACVAADVKPANDIFLAKGDQCSGTSVFIMNGRINASWTCQRPGKGQVMPAADGKYTADSFEVLVTTGTWFSGTGDYELTQRMKGKRVGDCPAAAPAP